MSDLEYSINVFLLLVPSLSAIVIIIYWFMTNRRD